ncbi:methyltransferase domain-containing protein [Streptomyces sp. NPDC088789]|uniref:methyltransferase domain-containing protein n=1 Tax=Streptomyces sp. NPDC088789 TaxID=3365899 RepID=UPI00380409AE
MSPLDVAVARPHMAALSDELTRGGAVRTPVWADAFATVPRHALVPRWYEPETNEKGITVWRERHTDDEASLAEIYRDETLVTALDPATAEQVDTNAWTGFATSSSTQPSLMAGMLEDLDIQDGNRVLEIGTGTGYNAALLCARLGDSLVHSIDVNPDLVETARRRLSDCGFAPQLLACDGTQGHPTVKGFERIIATCSVPSIPWAWIYELRPGGTLVADLNLGIEGGIVQLTGRADAARGYFTKNAGRFMPARTDTLTYPRPERSERAPVTGSRATALVAYEIRSNYALRLVLAFQLPGTELVYHVDDDGLALQLQRDDGSWARVPLVGDTRTVTYGGDGELWKAAEAAWEWWQAAGRPEHDAFGYVREPKATYAWYRPDGTLWHLNG